MCKSTPFIEEAYAQFLMAWQTCLTMLCKRSLDVVSVIFVGHLGEHYLGAAGLASVTANVFGNSLIAGLGGALQTICSQAYGAKDFDALGVALQQAILILTVVCSFITVFWMYCEHVFIYLGQSEEISHDAAKYLLFLAPGLFGFSTAACIQNWLFSQQITLPSIISSIIVALLHPIWNYLFIIYLDFGYIGAAIAVSSSKCLECLILISYLLFSNILIKTKFELSIRAFYNWNIYLKIAIPNLLMMSEWWSSEIIIFLSGTLLNPDLHISCMSIYQNVNGLCFQFSNGMQITCCARVGNFLGNHNITSAKMAAKVSPLLTFVLSLTLSSILLGFRHKIGHIFSNDMQLIDTLSVILIPLSVYVVGDGVQAALTGVIRGVGKQYIAGPIVIVCYFIIGLPIACFLAFYMHLGILGLCIGTCIAKYIHMITYLVVVTRLDWEDELVITKERLSKISVVSSSHRSTTLELTSSKHGGDSIVSADMDIGEDDQQGMEDDSREYSTTKAFMRHVLRKISRKSSLKKSSIGGMSNERMIDVEYCSLPVDTCEYDDDDT